MLVSPWFPWPETWGSGIRLANIVRGLARVGDVDVFVVEETPPEVSPEIPSGFPVRRLGVAVRPQHAPSVVQRMRWLARGSMPRLFSGRDYHDVRSKYQAWETDGYDLAWFYTVEPYVALQQAIRAATIVEIDQLLDYTMEDILALKMTAQGHDGSGVTTKLRNVVARIQNRKDIRLYRSLYASISASADAVVVNRALDRQRLPMENVVVTPIGYDYQSDPVGHTAIGETPTIVFPALLTYGPNVDGASYLVREIVPRLRRKIPSVQIRLVGTADADVQRLHAPPGIVVTNFVPDIRPELAKAHLIAVPLRFGGGTRVKILEAFAHRIPVVSTTMGAEGIEATHGREIILADTPEDFSEACVRVLTDTALQRKMVDAAHALFLRKYRWDQIQEMIASLAIRIAGRDSEAPVATVR